MHNLKLVLVFIVGLINFISFAANTNVEINLPQFSKDTYKVKVIFNEVNQKTNKYYLQGSSANNFITAGFGFNIVNIVAKDENDQQIKHKVKSKQMLLIKSSTTLKSLEYEVLQNQNLAQKNNFLAAGLIAGEDHYLINYNALIGYLNIENESDYKVELFGTRLKHFHTNKVINENENSISTLFKSYLDMYNNPLLINNLEAQLIEVDKTKFKIAFVDETNNLTTNQIAMWLKPIINAAHNFTGDFATEQYQFILYFSDFELKSKDEIKKFGGLHRDKTSLYVLPKLSKTGMLKSIVQKTAMHELLHLFIPGKLKSNAKNNTTKHMWLYEGVVEYFSLLLLYRNGLISESKFLSEWSNKIRTTETLAKTSLADMSENMSSYFNGSQLINFYNKAAIVAFFLDIEINAYSNGDKNLIDVLQNIERKTSLQGGFNDTELIDLINNEVKNDFTSFYQDYILNRNDLQYNAHFKKIGLQYFERFADEKYDFGNVIISFNKKQKYFFVKSATSNNNFNIKVGDIITAINDKASSKITASEFYNLILYPAKNQKVKLTVLRDDEIINTTGISTFGSQKILFHILQGKENLTKAQLLSKYQVLGNAK